MMNTMNNTVYAGSKHSNNSTHHASPYSLIKPSQSPAVSRRYLEDWAHVRTTQTRGLRRDLHALLSKLNPYYGDAITALLWASIIPTTLFLGTLVEY